MYAVNPELYLSGVGYGSSYIAELYQLGGLKNHKKVVHKENRIEYLVELAKSLE